MARGHSFYTDKKGMNFSCFYMEFSLELVSVMLHLFNMFFKYFVIPLCPFYSRTFSSSLSILVYVNIEEVVSLRLALSFGQQAMGPGI